MELNQHTVNVITFDICMDVAFRPVRLSNLSPNSWSVRTDPGNFSGERLGILQNQQRSQKRILSKHSFMGYTNIPNIACYYPTALRRVQN